MMRKSKGPRHRTRRKLSRPPYYRVPITKFLQNFSIGEKVVIVPEPSSQKGLPFRRFKGKVGTVIERRGRSYVVQITDGGKVKKIISRPEHLQKV